MSQAQSISNLCNQRALEIQRELDSYNVCSKSIRVNGEDYSLEIDMGKEWLEGDMNFTVVLYRIDRYKTKNENDSELPS